MKPSTLIVWLLVAACIAGDLAMIGELQVRRDSWPGMGGVVGLGLAFMQGCLIAVWAVWGSGNTFLRTVSALIAAWGLGIFITFCDSPGSPEQWGQWFGGVLIYLAVILIPCTAMRLIGYRLTLSGQPINIDATRVKPRQFTTWNLLSIITSIGVALGAFRHADLPSWQETLEGVYIFTVLGAVAITLFFTSLVVRHSWAAVALGLILSPCSGYFLSFTTGTSTLRIQLTLMSGVLALSTVATGKILRSGGYRLRRTGNGKLSEARKSASSDRSKSVSADRRGAP